MAMYLFSVYIQTPKGDEHGDPDAAYAELRDLIMSKHAEIQKKHGVDIDVDSEIERDKLHEEEE